RGKELACLYRLGEGIESCEGALDPLGVLFQGAVDLLPGAWLHSDIAHARIVVGGREYATAGFCESAWAMGANFVFEEHNTGVMEVHYSQETPTLDEGPFLKEERSLIDSLAGRIGRAAERIQAKHIVHIEQAALQQKNIALREILNKIQQEKKGIGRQVMANVDKVILPVLDDLEQGLTERQRKVVGVLRDSLNEIIYPFVDRLSSSFEMLTPAEIRICTLVRRGMSCKEIAAIEHISPGTVRVHRFKIRRKLGLLNSKVNLRTFLCSSMYNEADG
ncbi:MAG: LuxR family transcriptional regulator, partial [Phycisphaerales bacterium]|nr:LuxR family transcriptional regulator [Phycisphaerales bacterium]